jgi:ubiquinone/menaquinone biosynthesis C-methylase UbiE
MAVELFDDWPDRYDRWFVTPIGRLVKEYESELILELLKPGEGEIILDAGCGTGIFTRDILSFGSRVVGLDISMPMLMRAGEKTTGYPFYMVAGDMLKLPFPDSTFDKVVSVTAIEFIEDAVGCVRELFRVARGGGCIVVATLNSLSPWATRRRSVAEKADSVFKGAIFRSPDEMRSLAPVSGIIRTAIHFMNDDDPDLAREIERTSVQEGLHTGAFIAARWEKQ